MRGQVFLIDPAAGETLKKLEKHINAAQLDVRTFAVPADIVAVLRDAALNAGPLAVVIGPRVANALATARGVRAVWDGHLLFVPEESGIAPLRRDLAVAPMLGENWSVCAVEDPQLTRMLASIARASLQRRQLRTTLDRANLRISARDPVDPVRYRALFLSDRYFATILKQAPEPIIVLDARDVVTAWNSGAEQALGHEARHAVGVAVADLPSWPKPLNAALAQARSAVQPVLSELVVSTGQGERHFRANVSAVLDDARAYVGAAIFMHDVTESVRALAAEHAARVQAEQMNRMKDEFLTMVDGMAQLAWMARPDGWIYWYNKRWYEYTGTTAKDMEGWGWQGVHDPQALPQVVERWKHSIATGEPFEMIFPLRGADGRFRPFLTRVSPLKDAHGRVVQWFGTNTDITAQREAEQALRDADRRKDEFLATLAHELRNPLAPIRNAVEILGQLQPLPERVEGARAVLDRQSRHLTRLVDDLLEVSRITQGKVQLRKERMALQRSLNDAVEAARPALQAKGHRLSVDLPAEPLEVEADVTRITQIFLNLLNNAVKFTPREGHIWVGAERRGGEAVVWVRDTGVGIAAEHLPTLFEMFSQIDPVLARSEAGLGIGLALVRGLVSLHGGVVEAHSAGSGKGSEFLVRLPVSQRGAGELEAPASRSAPPRTIKRRRVLVVDDNRDAAGTLRQLLELAGHEVREAHDGVEGVQAAGHFRPDIVLLDIGMPRMNGYEAAREIRRQAGQRAIRIVAMTGWGQEADKQRARDAGFDLHLTKPLDPVALENLFADELPGTIHFA